MELSQVRARQRQPRLETSRFWLFGGEGDDAKSIWGLQIDLRQHWRNAMAATQSELSLVEPLAIQKTRA